jgi:pimeloyl-ACP methyl ester carboxylesterase
MNWLSDHRRLERFILFGLCSGADNALATAEADPRVVGLVLVDPPSYVTPQAKVRHALTRASTLTNPKALASWSGAALRRLGGIMDKLLEAPEEAADADEPEERVLGREVPSQAEYGELLHLLTDRGLSILSIYSAALRERFNHPDQLIELYPELKGKVQTLYFPEANHVFTELDAQAGLVSGVCDWVERSR